METVLFPVLLLAAAAWVPAATARVQQDISYAYSYKLAPLGGSYLQASPSSGVATPSCSGAADCLAKCPNDAFIGTSNATPASVQQQLFDCANAVRTSPDAFADAINAVCSYSNFSSAVTQPARSALAANQELSELALAHSDDMAANNSFSHTSSTGESPADRIRAAFPNANAVGELIAAGYSSVQSVIISMMCSDSHRAVLTSCDYDTLGWGVQFGSTVSSGQQIRGEQYPSYFTADLLCSNSNGCACPGSAVAPAPSSQQQTAAPQPSSAIQISFQLSFLDIPAGSLNSAQTSSVAQDVQDAISAFTSPVSVLVQVTGGGLAPPTSAGGRRLLQSENTLQATVTFTATTSAATSADSSSLISDLTAAITAYVTQAPVTVTATPVTSGAALALQVSVQFPPNNQVSTEPAYTTQLAASFANAAANQTSSVFASFIAKDGALTVSGVQTAVAPVSASAATNLGPPAPIPVIATVTTPAAAPAAAPVAQTPPTAPPASPPPAAGPTSTPAASPPQAAGPAGPVLVLSVVASVRANETTAAQDLAQALQYTPEAALYSLIARDGRVVVGDVSSSVGLPNGPVAGPTAAPGPASAIAPTTPPAASTAPAAAPAEAAAPGPAPTPSQSAPPVEGAAPAVSQLAPSSSSITTPAADPVEGAAPGPAPTPSQPGCGLYALNMQFSSGRAETDQAAAALLATQAGAAAPPASRFQVQLANGSAGAVDGVLPYGTANYLLQVSTPRDYLGPVTVADSGGSLASLTYYKVASLVVRVTASSLTSVSR